MRALLDVNVLLALFDEDHVNHRLARDWLVDRAETGWASCPITENGFIRIISQPSYPNAVGAVEAIAMLAAARLPQTHAFWPADVSLVDASTVDPSRVLGPKQVTDLYLLALAVAHGGRFVTFDDRVPLAAVPAAERRHLVVLGR